MEPESKYSYPDKNHEDGSSAEKRTCRFTAYAMDKTKIVQLVAEYIAKRKQYIAAGHNKRNGKHFPRHAIAVNITLHAPMHGNFDIRRKLCDGDEAGDCRHRYDGNPKENDKESFRRHRVRLSFDDDDIIEQVKTRREAVKSERPSRMLRY